MMLLMRSCISLKQSQRGVLHALFGDLSERIRIKTLLRLFGIVLEFDAERKTSQLGYTRGCYVQCSLEFASNKEWLKISTCLSFMNNDFRQ